MRIDLLRPFVLAAGVFGAIGCAAPTAASDLSQMRRLSRMDLPPSTSSEEVDLETAADARALLGRPLTADAAVRVALLNNRELRATLREVGIARGEVVQAGTLPNPEIEVEATPPQRGLDRTRLELSVEYDVTSAILAPLRTRAARAEHEASRYRSAGAVVELGYEVRAAFYAVQSAEQRLGIANRALDAFAAARDAARTLFEAGNIAELDAATQEAGYETARLTAAQLELTLLDQRERLNRLLGLSGAQTAWTIAGELSAAPDALATPPRAETQAITSSLELAELRGRLDGAASRAGLARTEGWLPDMSLGVRAEREVGARGEPEEDAWLVGARLRLQLPLFDRRQGESAARRAELDALLERYEGRAVDIRSALRAARNRLVSAHARAQHYRRVVVPARKRVMDQTLLQYNAMQLGVFQLLQARREQLDADLAQVETLREFWTAKAAFDALLSGRRVEGPGMADPAAMPTTAGTEGGH